MAKHRSRRYRGFLIRKTRLAPFTVWALNCRDPASLCPYRAHPIHVRFLNAAHRAIDRRLAEGVNL